MLFELNADQASYVAAATKGASGDSARPILTGINLQWKVQERGNELVLDFVATDSYVLCHRQVTLAEGFVLEDDDKKKGSVLIPAKEFAKAIIEVGKTVTGHVPVEFRKVVVATDDREVTVANFDGSFSRTLRLIEGEFPKWEKLINEETSDVEGDNAAYFNGAYIKRLIDAVAPAKLLDRPIRFEVYGLLKPAKVSYNDTNNRSTFVGIQMPVRV